MSCSLFRFGCYVDDAGMSYYAIEKKVWWGWKEINYWAWRSWLSGAKKTAHSCRLSCFEAVKELREAGVPVLNNLSSRLREENYTAPQ